jgi:hypothetical protein
MKNVTIKTTNKFSIISIVNWNIYQQTENGNDQQNVTRTTSRRPADDHIQERKKEKNNTYSADFLSFYSAYPRKVAKLEAWKAWEKCNGDRPEIALIINSVERQKNSAQWKKENGQFIPHPATWINKKRWEDEVEGGSDGGPFSSTYS